MKFISTNKYDAGLRAQLGIHAPTVGGPALPSGDAALALVKGEKGSALKVAETMGLRAALVAAGLLCAGFPAALLVRGTIGAVLGIEAGVLAWAYTNRTKRRAGYSRRSLVVHRSRLAAMAVDTAHAFTSQPPGALDDVPPCAGSRWRRTGR